MLNTISKTSTTSIVAVLIVFFAFFLIGFMAVSYGDDATTRTQIITGLLTSIAAVTGYYFGSTKNRPQVQQNAENINNSTS
jgi:hypothetical protein